MQKSLTYSLCIINCPLSIVVCLGLLSCRKHADPPPTARPSTPNPFSTTEPVVSLNIDGRPVPFAPAKMIVTPQGGGLNIVLRSDDLSGDKSTNTFFLEMQLDVDAVENLSTIVWEFKASNELPQDSTAGIYLDGNHRRLQPLDVKATFKNQGNRAISQLTGTFLSFNPQDANSPVEKVNVDGTIDAAIKEQN